jgi:hypothetical protein
MPIKNDKMLAQATIECNENPKAEQNQEVFDKVAKGTASDLERLVRAEVANRPDLSPEDLFLALHGFVTSVAQSMRDVLALIEDIMVEKDKSYPRGLMIPSFLCAFMEHAGEHCQFMQIPEEIAKQLSEVTPMTPKETVH